LKYLLTLDNSQEKMFCIVGEKRRGKGVLVYIIVRILGVENCTSFSTYDLEKDDGISDWPGKALVFDDEARYDKIKHGGQVLRHLLSVTGRGTSKVKQLYKDRFNADELARILIAGKRLPYGLPDTGRHLESRIICWPAEGPCFENNPKINPNLRYELTTEPKLENWCEWIIGGDSISPLKNPDAAADYISEMNALSDKHWKFGEDCLEFDKRFVAGMGMEQIIHLKIFTVTKADMFLKWEQWCKEKRYDEKVIGTSDKFITDLKGSLKGRAEYKLKTYKGKRNKIWIGCRFKKELPF